MKMQLVLLVFSAVFFALRANGAQYDIKELQCLVCQATLTEFEKALAKLDPAKKVDVGSYRLDAKGNYHQKSVSEAQSEIKLSEMLDEVCNKMDDYVRATWKDNGKLTLIRMIGDDGKMTNEMGNVDFIQDDDLNKSLKYYCELVLEEHEDSIINHYVNNHSGVKAKICKEEAKLCTSLLPEGKLREDL